MVKNNIPIHFTLTEAARWVCNDNDDMIQFLRMCLRRAVNDCVLKASHKDYCNLALPDRCIASEDNENEIYVKPDDLKEYLVRFLDWLSDRSFSARPTHEKMFFTAITAVTPERFKEKLNVHEDYLTNKFKRYFCPDCNQIFPPVITKAINALETPCSKKSGTKFSREEVIEMVKKGESLEGADLSGIDLSNAPLNGANLSFTKINSATLTGAKLDGAIFHNADIRFSNVNSAVVTSSNLIGAKLNEANFSGSDLSNSDVSSADVVNACFIKTKLNKANLSNSDLKSSDFEDADLAEADISGANIHNIKTPGWKIGNIQCTHAYNQKKSRNFAPGEFESNNKMHQDIETLTFNPNFSSHDNNLLAGVANNIEQRISLSKPEQPIVCKQFECKDYKSFIKNLKISCGDANDEINIQLPGKEVKKYPCHILGFRNSNTSQWKTLIKILKEPNHTYCVGKSHDYGSKSKREKNKCDFEPIWDEEEQNQQGISEYDHGMALVEGKRTRQRNPEYDRKLRILQEINKKLILFLNKHYSAEILDDFRLYEICANEESGTYRFIFQVVDDKNIESDYSNYTSKKEILDDLRTKRKENAPWEDICICVQEAFLAEVNITEKDILEIFPDKSLKDFAPSFN